MASGPNRLAAGVGRLRLRLRPGARAAGAARAGLDPGRWRADPVNNGQVYSLLNSGAEYVSPGPQGSEANSRVLLAGAPRPFRGAARGLRRRQALSLPRRGASPRTPCAVSAATPSASARCPTPARGGRRGQHGHGPGPHLRLPATARGSASSVSASASPSPAPTASRPPSRSSSSPTRRRPSSASMRRTTPRRGPTTRLRVLPQRAAAWARRPWPRRGRLPLPAAGALRGVRRWRRRGAARHPPQGFYPAAPERPYALPQPADGLTGATAQPVPRGHRGPRAGLPRPGPRRRAAQWRRGRRRRPPLRLVPTLRQHAKAARGL